MATRTKWNELYTIASISDLNETLFGLLSDSETYPLVNSFINNTNWSKLELDYFISFSNDKYISPLVQKLLDYYGNDADNLDDVFEYTADIIYQRFGVKWKKIYDALMTEYSPLENYHMEETRTPDLTDVRTPNITKSEDGTNGTTSSAQNGVYGFNSSESQPNTTASGTQSNTIDIDTTETGTETFTHTGTESLERAGNIGVTTSQQMLESELKLREYDFYKMIYKDIDSILCLGIY